MYDFNLFGNCMSFDAKIYKHIMDKNADRVKDYVCGAYNTFDPIEAKNHPCIASIMRGINFLKSQGWQVKVARWKTIGEQIILINPEEKYYHSEYEHKKLVQCIEK